MPSANACRWAAPLAPARPALITVVAAVGVGRQARLTAQLPPGRPRSRPAPRPGRGRGWPARTRQRASSSPPAVSSAAAVLLPPPSTARTCAILLMHTTIPKRCQLARRGSMHIRKIAYSLAPAAPGLCSSCQVVSYWYLSRPANRRHHGHRGQARPLPRCRSLADRGVARGHARQPAGGVRRGAQRAARR